MIKRANKLAQTPRRLEPSCELSPMAATASRKHYTRARCTTQINPRNWVALQKPQSRAECTPLPSLLDGVVLIVPCRYGLQLAHLHHEGERIIADISTPEEALAALKKNPAFVQEVQLLALNYIVRDHSVLPRHALKNLLFVRQEDTVCSTQIPKVLGEKEWGTYSIDGLAINRVRVVARGRYWSARVFDTLRCPAVYH
jgi:hypothetical protein